MEAQFGQDFSRVRVHADGQAAQAAQAVGSDAFTVGNHVVFGTSQWVPQTVTGSRLLAHELVHVIQQRPALSSADGELRLGERNDPAEREAETAAAGFGGPGLPKPAEQVLHSHIARQETGQDDRPLATLSLMPTDARVSKTLERIAAADGKGTSSPGGKDVDPACQASVAQSPPWMPGPRRPSPIELGKGTRREPKLKEPDGPAGAKCRGACGADCPDTCKPAGTYLEQYEVGGCGYLIEFPNALQCGTHSGCRLHDGCFDAAVAAGETQLGGPLHFQCNEEALLHYGPAKTTSWARGGGPYDAWWYFVDDPVVRKSWRVRNPAESTSDLAP
jgi:hypothetical protein